MSIPIRMMLALLAAASLVAACSQDDPESTTSPSSALPTGATGGTGASGATGELPTTSPGSATGHVNGGSVSFKTTGDLKVKRTLDQLVSTAYEPPPDGALVLVWTAGEGDGTTLGIGGSSFSGTRPTSDSLTLTLVIQTDEGTGEFQSHDGECEITIDVATETQIAGSFRCDDIAAVTGQDLGVSGSFRAEG
jgi:hypothetical protein